MEVQINSCTLKLVQGDITELKVEAIVNPANSALVLGGGVAGAIRQKGGPMIQQECDKIGDTPTGSAVITTGGNLKAKNVIHAVGPTGDNPNRNLLLESAVKSVFDLVYKNGLKSVALPAISTGIFGFPIRPASKIILMTSLNEIKTLPEDSNLTLVIICLFDRPTFTVFNNTLNEVN